MTTPKPEELLPQAVIAQHLQQLKDIAIALAPTADIRALCGSDDALQHAQLMRYVTGTEHLELAIAYLEWASGVKETL